jgi:hypothetical protein
MAPVTRQTKIDFLVRRKFRGISVAAPPLGTPSISLSGERLARKDPNAREAILAYRTQLSAMAEEDLDALFASELTTREEEERAQAEFAEQERFFNQHHAMADFDHWSRSAYWTLDEAVALSLGRSPEVVNWEKVKPYIGASNFAEQYRRRRDLVMRARDMQQLYDQSLPGFFLAWAKRNDIAVADGLETLVKQRGGQVADWKTLYDDLKEKTDAHHIECMRVLDSKNADIGTLLKRVEEFEARLVLSKASVPAGSPEPLGARERESLLKLIIGMAVFGYGYVPTAPRSQKPGEIAEDLARAGVALDVDTVRKWLKEAAELLPPNPDGSNRA